MSEERLIRIESKLDLFIEDQIDLKRRTVDYRPGQAELRAEVSDLKAGVAELRTDVNDLKVGVAELRVDVNELKAGVAEIRADVAELRIEVKDIQAGQVDLGAAFVDLRRYVGVLHEEALNRIRAIGQDDGLRQEMRRGFAELSGLLSNHVLVGDAVDQEHSRQLADHETRLQSIETRDQGPR